MLVSWNERTIEVTADEATLAEVGPLLAGIEAASFGDELLDVRALWISAADESFDGPTRMLEAEADRRERALLAAKHGRLLRRATTALADGATARADSLPRTGTSPTSTTSSPTARRSSSPSRGRTSSARRPRARRSASSGSGGSTVAMRVYVLGPVSTPNGPQQLASPTPHEDDLPTAQPSDLTAAMFHERVPLKVETPVRGGIGLAGSFVVPDGQVRWLPCRATTKRGPVALVLEVRTHGPFRPPVQRFAGAGARTRDARVVHLGAVQSRGFKEPGFDFASLDPRSQPVRHGDEEPGTRHAGPSLAALAVPERDPSGTLGELARRVEASHEIGGSLRAGRNAGRRAGGASPTRRAARAAAATPVTFALGGRVVATGRRSSTSDRGGASRPVTL